MLPMALTVSTHACILVTIYYSCSYMSSKVLINERHEICRKTCAYATKCTSAFHANQRYMCTVRANYDAHGSRLMSWVYICELHYVIDLSCTCRLCCKHFQKLIKLCSICMCVWSSLN